MSKRPGSLVGDSAPSYGGSAAYDEKLPSRHGHKKKSTHMNPSSSSSDKRKKLRTSKKANKKAKRRQRRQRRKSMSSSEGSGSTGSSSMDGSESLGASAASSLSGSGSASGSDLSDSEETPRVASHSAAPSIAPVATASSASPLKARLKSAHLADKISWSQAIHTYTLSGSLLDHKTASGDDGKVAVTLAAGVVPESQPPSLTSRQQTQLLIHSRADIASAPANYTKPHHAVRDVTIDAHNGSPATQVWEFPNLKGSHDQMHYFDADGKPVNHLVITLKPGETRSQAAVMSNLYHADALDVYGKYPDYNQNTLRNGVRDYPSADGIERYVVPHNSKSRHPVIDTAMAKMANEGHLSRRQLSHFKKTGELPSELIAPWKDNPGAYFIISKKLFDTYEPRVIKGMSSSSPLSDVAHPYALVSRASADSIKFADSVNSQNRLDAIQSKKELWLKGGEVHANRSKADAKDAVFSTAYTSWVRTTVRFAETKELTDRLMIE